VSSQHSLDSQFQSAGEGDNLHPYICKWRLVLGTFGAWSWTRTPAIGGLSPSFTGDGKPWSTDITGSSSSRTVASPRVSTCDGSSPEVSSRCTGVPAELVNSHLFQGWPGHRIQPWSGRRPSDSDRSMWHRKAWWAGVIAVAENGQGNY